MILRCYYDRESKSAMCAKQKLWWPSWQTCNRYLPVHIGLFWSVYPFGCCLQIPTIRLPSPSFHSHISESQVHSCRSFRTNRKSILLQVGGLYPRAEPVEERKKHSGSLLSRSTPPTTKNQMTLGEIVPIRNQSTSARRKFRWNFIPTKKLESTTVYNISVHTRYLQGRVIYLDTLYGFSSRYTWPSYRYKLPQSQPYIVRTRGRTGLGKTKNQFQRGSFQARLPILNAWR